MYLEMLIKLVERQSDIADLVFDSVGGNILHLACKSENIELVKYIISLNKIDIRAKTIFIYLFI